MNARFVASASAGLLKRLAAFGLLTLPLAPFAWSVVVRAAAADVESSVSRELPALAFHQYLVDLGPLGPQAPAASAHFRFVNKGGEPVRITALEPSCGCLKPRLSRKLFQPGTNGGFDLTVQTAGEPAGPKEYSVRVHYTDPDPRSVTLFFRCELPDRKVVVEPRGLMFYQLNGRPASQTITVTDHRDRPLCVTGVESTSPLAVATLLSTDSATDSPAATTAELLALNRRDPITQLASHTVDGDDEATDAAPRYRVRVDVAGAIPPSSSVDGRHRALIQITTDDPDFRVLQVPILIQGPKRGDGRPPLVFTPNPLRIDAGDKPVTETVELTAHGRIPPEVDSVTASSDLMTAEFDPFKLVGPDRWRMPIRVTVDKGVPAGRFRAVLRVNIVAPTARELTLPVLIHR